MHRPRMSGSLTDHLVLQNLELEMELLKKKRDLLERRMEPLGREGLYDLDMSDRSYDQHLYQDQPQHNFNREFPNRQLSKNRGKQFGKRQHDISPWENDIIIPNKRQSSYHSSTSFSNEPMSLMAINTGFSNQRSNVKKFAPPQSARKNFKPTKVVKRKPATLNNLNSHSLPERKALVAEASKFVKINKPMVDEESMILHPDKIPTQQMTGRLELALGRIIKELKAKYEETDKIRFFIEPPLSRNLKQAVRERLKNVMLGKSVANYIKIYDTYRENYSLHSDAEIVEKCANDIKTIKPAITFRPSDNPKAYIKCNFKKFLTTKFTEMFEELQNLYKNKTEEEIVASNSFSDVYILKNVYKHPGGRTTESSEKKDESDNPEKENTSETQEKDDSIAIQENVKVEGDQGEKTVQTNKPYFEKSDEEKLLCCNTFIHKMFNETLPVLLTKYVPKILSMMDDDQAFNVLRESMFEKANEMRKDMSTTTPPCTPWKYCVKLISKPHLPKRDVLQPFLDKFKPIAVKKPKSNSRMLLIGFNEKENYDNILSASGTVLEDMYVLFIVAGHTKGKINATTDDTSTNTTTNTSTTSTDNNDVIHINDEGKEILNVELEDQISDLLSAIKRDEADGIETDDNAAQDEKAMNVTENTLDNGNNSTDAEMISAENTDENVTEGKKETVEYILIEDTEGDVQVLEHSNDLIEDDDTNTASINKNSNADDVTEEKVNQMGDTANNEGVENQKNELNKQSPVRRSSRRVNVTTSTPQTGHVSEPP